MLLVESFVISINFVYEIQLPTRVREALQKKMLLKYEFFPKGGGGSRPIQKFRGTFFVPHNCQKGGGSEGIQKF